MKIVFLLRSLTAAALGLLVFVPAALSHVDVEPRLVDSGREVTLIVELPELRPNLTPTRLEVRAGDFEQRSSTLVEQVGDETRWRVDAHVAAPPGPLELTLRAGFADGRTVVARQTLTVLPAREDATPWVTVAATAGVLAAAAAALLLRQRRRRSL